MLCDDLSANLKILSIKVDQDLFSYLGVGRLITEFECPCAELATCVHLKAISLHEIT